jgi:hypothetical protein
VSAARSPAFRQGAGQAAGQVGQGGAQAAGQGEQAAGDATGAAQAADEDAGQQSDAGGGRARKGQTKRGSKRGTRLSRSSEDDGERGGVVSRAARVGQAAAKATEQLGKAAVEASGKAEWMEKDAGEARSAGQQRRPASRRSREGATRRGSKRGTRSRSSDDDGK